MWHRFGYHSSHEWCEAVADRLITDDCKWIDVGGGSSIFSQIVTLSDGEPVSIAYVHDSIDRPCRRCGSVVEFGAWEQ
jgi:hypothetical protein